MKRWFFLVSVFVFYIVGFMFMRVQDVKSAWRPDCGPGPEPAECGTTKCINTYEYLVQCTVEHYKCRGSPRSGLCDEPCSSYDYWV